MLAHWDARAEELVVYLSTQIPHLMRTGLSQMLNLPSHQLRIIAPDVGGGFGGKARLMPEEIVVCAIALDTGKPVRWLEDRREHLMAALATKYGDDWATIKASLEASFEEFEQHGFCLSLGDWDRNVMAAGVPLHMADGSIMALTCGAPSFQLSEETLKGSLAHQLDPPLDRGLDHHVVVPRDVAVHALLEQEAQDRVEDLVGLAEVHAGAAASEILEARPAGGA